MNGSLGLQTLPEQDCVFEELRGTQTMGPARSDVRQSGVSTSRAALRMSDYRTDTQGPFFLGLGNWDDGKGRNHRCEWRQVSVLIRSGKREKKQEIIPQRVFGARSQAFEWQRELVLSDAGNGEAWERTLSGFGSLEDAR